ncbi:hypothetical protein ALC56_04678 [Trachymyrmex septentrionalis]|uniref:Uncharacterized protein n=1 Tax=Trachymyrmex septentrionalis TaxID=34720 RepID=A0A151JY70_9HYME|nr:hypothetical protein ALC56_04678 [Trachymyrmex septentrionalis]
MAQQRPEDIVQLYTESGLDAEHNQLFKCECCRQESKPDYTVDYGRMIRHLYIMHDKSEIMDNPEYKSVVISFNFQRQHKYEIVGKCIVSNCGVIIKSKFGRALPFKNHLITHHADDKKNFFAKVVGIVAGRKILNNYEITDTEIAKCSFCRTTKPLKNLDSQTAKVLADLGKHLNLHNTCISKILQVPFLDEEASIQIELEEEEKMHLEVDKNKQSIDEAVGMEEILRSIDVASEGLNMLLQRYNSVIINDGKKSPIVKCEINECGHRTTLVNDKLYRIKNHWEIHHGPKNKIYNEVKNDQTMQQIFQRYKIMYGNLAICSVCQHTENLEEDTQLSLDKLQNIHKHWMDDHRSGQSIPNEDVLETPETSDSSEIRSVMTQSSSIVKYGPGQCSSSRDEGVPEASVSGEMQNTTTQSLLTGEPLSKQRRLDSGNYSLCLCHVKINLTYCTICNKSNFS